MDDIRRYEPLFGSWTVDRVIGEGSFGKVYALKKMDFGREYYSALKVITIPQNKSEISGLRSEGMDDRSLREHFKQVVSEVVSEFDLMSRFRGNSNIVSYEDHMLIPNEDGYGYSILIRMELLTSLVQVLEQNSFSKKDVIRLGIDMCKALELCQKHDIIHRDIKPENIFVSSNGDFKLGDFGIARTSEKTGGEMSKKGTYTYMAPEVYKGDPYGSDVDIYSLGIVLYRLLNGNRTPFLPLHPAPITHSDRENALMRRISGAPIPAPSGAGGRLAEIVMKAIEYNPKDRFISPIQMRQELEVISYSESEGQIIYPTGDRVELPPNQYAGRSAEQLGVRSEELGVGGQQPPQGNVPYGGAPYPPNQYAGGSAGQLGVRSEELGVGGQQLPQGNVPYGGAPYPPNQYVGGSAGQLGVRSEELGVGGQQPPQGNVPYGGAPYPQQPPQRQAPVIPNSAFQIPNSPPYPPVDYDATVADLSASAPLYPPAPAQIPAKGKPSWLKWAIIGGAAVIVIVVLIIVLSSNSKKTSDNDDDTTDISTVETETDDSSKESEAPPTPEDELHGNTPGNISNGGFVAQNGEWLFYKGDDSKLYRMKPNGSENTVISDDACDYINVAGEWLYFSNASNGHRLYKMKIDGSEKIGLNEDNSAYINVVEDWIYYSNVSDGGKLYKITVAGIERTALGDNAGICLNAAGDWVYYCNSDDNNKIYKARYDGSGKSKISDDSSECICVAGDWVFYRNDSEGYNLYKVRNNGNEKTKLGDERCNYINAFGEWVYYTTWGDAALHKISMDGESSSKLSDSRAGNINVFGDWIYFFNWDNADKLFKIRTDGIQMLPIDFPIEIQSQAGQQTSEPGLSPVPGESPPPGESAGQGESPKPGESPGPSESPPPSESPRPSESPPPGESPRPSESPPPGESPRPSESPPPGESPKPSESPRPDQSGSTTGSISDKIWNDMSTGNFVSMAIGMDYQVYNRVSIYLTEVEPTLLDNGDLYIGVGIIITNNLNNDIDLEMQDFVCSSYSRGNFGDFRSPDMTIDASDQLLRYPVTVPANSSKYLTLGFKIPVDADMAIFAYTNIWGSDYVGNSYIYFISE